MSINNDLSSNQTIYEAIRKIALHKYVNKNNDTFRNSELKTGYVVKVHTEASDKLCGTIDVKEYDSSRSSDNELDGYHKGVLLSAIQNNLNGMVVIPMVYSEVVITTDPVSLREYVIQYSHVDEIRLDSHQTASIGVTETEEWNSDEDSPDFDNLEKTGVHAHTTYTKNTIDSIAVGTDKQSSQLISDEKIELIHDKASNLLNDTCNSQIFDGNSVSIDKEKAVVTANKILLGDDNTTHAAVLGDELATFLIDFLDALSKVKVTTQLGPQPFINLAQFIILKTKVNAYKSSISGFLSKTVKVKE